MSLNWDVTKCTDLIAIGVGTNEQTDAMTPEERVRYSQEWAITEHMIFSTMVTGLFKEHAITEQNHVKLFERLSAFEHVLNSPLRWHKDGTTIERWLAVDDVRKRIGLQTNVSPVSDAVFERKLGRMALDAAHRRVK